MNSNFIGNKYNSDLSTVECAKLIRKELKEKFKNIVFSIHSEYYSMGSSITIRILNCGFNFVNPLYNSNNFSVDVPYYTEKALQLLNEIKKTAQQYNYDRSDSQTDYFDNHFYLDVDFKRGD